MASDTTPSYLRLFPYISWAVLLPLVLATPLPKLIWTLIFMTWIFFGAGWAREPSLRQYPLLRPLLVGLDTVLGPGPHFFSQAVPAVAFWIRVSNFRFDRPNCWLVAGYFVFALSFTQWYLPFSVDTPLREMWVAREMLDEKDQVAGFKDGISDAVELPDVIEERQSNESLD